MTTQCIARPSAPTRTTLLYVLAAALWVVGSDRLLAAVGLGPQSLAGTWKGLLFVLATGLTLYVLLRRHDARIALQQREVDFLTRLAQHTNDILILEDGDQRIVAANARAVEAYEIPLQELIGRRVSSLRSDSSRPRFDADRAEIAELGAAVYETEHRSASGRTFSVEVSTRPVDIRGRPYLHSSIRDLSAHWREHEWVRLFFESPFVGMAITSPATKRWVRFNDALCGILGYTREQLATKTWAEVTHPDDIDADVAEFLRVLDGTKEDYRMSKRFIRADGAVVHAIIDVRCMRKPDRSVDFFFATIQDISQERHTQFALARSRDLYAMLSAANAAVARGGDETRLLQEVCRIAVETGGFGLAVAFLADAGGRMEERARHASVQLSGDLAVHDAVMRLLDPAWPRVRDGWPFVCNEVEGRDLTQTWVGRAHSRGVEALAVHPLVCDGAVVGALALFSTDPGAFPADVQRLLDQVGDSLSFALAAQASQRARAAAARKAEELGIRLRSIIDASTSAIWLADPDGKILLANHSCAALMDREPRDIVGRTREEFIDADSAAEHRAYDRQVFETGRPLRVEEHLRTEDGELTLLSVKFPVCDADGRIFAVGGIATDVTESRRVADEIRAANERWTSLINASPAAICDLDLQGRVLGVWNPAAERLYGRPAGRVIGRRLPMRRDDVLERILECARSGVAVQDVETEVLRADGSAASVIASVAPIRDRAGATVSILVVTIDVSDRVRALRALAHSERTYRLLFERHPAPMWVYDLATRRILAVNESAVESYGYGRDEFLQLRIDDLRPAEELPRLHRNLESSPGGIQHSGIWFHRLRDGTRIEVEIDSHSLEFNGRSARLVMATDVSERLEAQRALQRSEASLRSLNQELEDRIYARTEELLAAKDRAEQSDRVKSAFLATMSHELRTPLNSIIGFSDLLLNGFSGPLAGEQEKQLRIINGSGRHLLVLISDLLDISRIEADALTLHLEPVDLCAIVRTESETFARQAADKGLRLEACGSCAEALAVHADPRRVRQIVGNLLSNAIKFTDTGAVRVTIERRGPYAEVLVEDSGIGIPADQMAGLFEPFRRVELPGHPSRDGTGLGLAIARRLAEAMGGSIRVESEPGRGSRFGVQLPLVAEGEPTCAS